MKRSWKLGHLHHTVREWGSKGLDLHLGGGIPFTFGDNELCGHQSFPWKEHRG